MSVNQIYRLVSLRNINYDINLWCEDHALIWKKLILSFWQKTRGQLLKITFITNISYSMSSFSHPKQCQPVISVRLNLSLDTINDSSFTRELGRFWYGQVDCLWKPIIATQHGDACQARHEIRQSDQWGRSYKSRNGVYLLFQRTYQNTFLQYFHINWFSWLPAKFIPFSLRHVVTTIMSRVRGHEWKKIILLSLERSIIWGLTTT